MNCPKCHAEVRQGARFCRHCGHDLDQALCPHCGAMTPSRNHFCDKCGQVLLVTGDVAARKPAIAFSPWLALIPVAALLIVAAYLLTRSDTPPLVAEPPPESTPTITVTIAVVSVEPPLTATLAPIVSPGVTTTPTVPFTSTPTHTTTPTDTPTSTNTPMPPDSITAAYNDQGRLNLRMGPGLNYPIAAIVEAGATFTVTGRTENAQWLEAQDSSNRIVWVLAEFLDLNYPASAAPLAAETPTPPTNYLVADSVADFSTTQAANRWLYLASTAPGSLEFEQIPAEGKWYRWTKGGRSPEMRLSAEGSYPSWNSDAARLWVNFYEGQLRIEGQAHKEQGAGNGGNGVALRVVQRRQPADGDPGFESELWSTILNPYDITGLAFQIPPFAVKQRDELYFITSALGDDRLDNTVFTARIYLVNEGGVEMTPTPTPTLAPAKPSPPPLCFEPRLRHHERSHGGAGEIVGYVYNSAGGRFTQGAIRVKGPAGSNQYVHDFPLTGDGGYEATLLVIHGPPPFAYTVQLVGPRVRGSGTWVLDYPEGQPRRAVVDWYQVACK